MTRDDNKPDDDLSLPRSTIDKMLSTYQLSIPRHVRDHLTTYLHQFIHYISSDANLLCEKEKKKTITHEHIYEALRTAGFGHFIEGCQKVYDETLNLSKMRPSRINKLKSSKFSIEELRMEQKKLFESARKEYENMEFDEEEK